MSTFPYTLQAIPLHLLLTMTKLYTIAKSSWGHASNIYCGTCKADQLQKNDLKLAYTIEYKSDAVVLDTVTSNCANGDDMTAVINSDGTPTAEIFTKEGGEYKAKRRFASMAWKFIGDGGIKYKWHVFQQGKAVGIPRHTHPHRRYIHKQRPIQRYPGRAQCP
ncbi:hypothetical protein DL89DRAFT_13897 [Linderina pennispora]|uniref:Uncharacterized protein n=1 Tax=Linderina pennispora TaxID=61395 RepID=A0A1Y1WLE9_9FUNG|nr:uncharacterized protein DL89DRAFT_13897 [Linderina pennispora]ORX74322.1 hypothetical protein DL89DRAFT_13897 [Linderina pennispora]